MNNRRIKLLINRNFFFHFLILIRFKNLIILGLTQYFARIFLIGLRDEYLGHIFEAEIFNIALATFLVAAAGYIINDYYDIKIDMINKPKRVVLNKRISRRVGLFMHGILSLTAIAVSYSLSFNVTLYVGFCGFLLWLYSNYLKRTAFWGNFAISFLSFSSLFILGLYYQRNMNLILLFGTFAFISTLIREIIKDMEDIKGDAAFGCHTLPILWGIAATKKLLYVIIFISIIFFVVSCLYINLLLYIYLLFVVVIPLILITKKITVADKKIDFAEISRWIKVMIVFGIFGMSIV